MIVTQNYFNVTEIFGDTLQGEGFLSGVPSLFLRFQYCNLACKFCDTDFSKGTYISIDTIIDRINSVRKNEEWITITGGEPLLQINDILLDSLLSIGLKIAVETNGSIAISERLKEKISCLTVSPKSLPNSLEIQSGHSLKLLYPLFLPEKYAHLKFDHYFLQPVMDQRYFENISLTVKKILELGGKWRLSLQLHKILSLR